MPSMLATNEPFVVTSRNALLPLSRPAVLIDLPNRVGFDSRQYPGEFLYALDNNIVISQ